MASTRRPKILFVTYGGGHVAMVLPIVKRLLREGLADPVVIALTIAGAACRREGIPSLGFKDFLPDDDEEILRLGRQLTAGDAGHPAVDDDESVAYHGLSYFDLVERLGADEAARAYAAGGRGAFLPLTVFERVLADIQPDLVVATNSPRSERAAIDAARRLGIPTCCIVDVFGVRSDWIMRPGFADSICVMSASVRDMIVARGQDPGVIEVTGNPAFDELAEVRDRRSSAGAHDDFRVLWAPHPEPAVSPIDFTTPGNLGLNRAIAAEFVRCATRHPDWNIVVRPHPSQGDLAVSGPANIVVLGDDDLDDRLVWADVVVTCASTVAVQASLAGIPTLAIAGSIVSDYVPLAEYRLALGVELDDLDATLDRLRTDPVLPDPGVPELGRATERVTATILRLARPRS